MHLGGWKTKEQDGKRNYGLAWITLLLMLMQREGLAERTVVQESKTVIKSKANGGQQWNWDQLGRTGLEEADTADDSRGKLKWTLFFPNMWEKAPLKRETDIWNCRSLYIGQVGVGNLEVEGFVPPMSNQMKFLPQLFNTYSKVTAVQKYHKTECVLWE